MGKETLSQKCLLLLLLLVFNASVLWAFNLTIIHTNDIHARFVEFNAYGGRCTKEEAEKGHCYGGFPRQVTMANKIRAEYPNVIYLNAGDFYQGTMWYTIFKYNVTTKFVNMLNLDAMALGNHEFDDGIPGLLPFVKDAKPPVLCCNCDTTGEPEFGQYINKSMVTNVGGKRIGVIGYITPDTSYLADAGKVIFTDEAQCLTEEAEKMKSDGIDIIIALGHSGYVAEQEIARKVKLLDVIVGGHSHTFLYKGVPPSSDVPEGEYPTVIEHDDGTKTLVVQDYSYAKYMGFLQVAFDSSGRVQSYSGNPILLNSSIAQDPVVLGELMKYQGIVEERGKSVVGKTAVLLRGQRSICRMVECNIGNFITDATIKHYVYLAKEKGWTSVPIAVLNSGGIRASIDEQINGGNITMEDILTVQPFENTVDIIDINGTQFKEMMETAVAKYDPFGKDAQGAFLQVSGVQVAYDISKPPGHRVVNLTIRCGECRVPRFLPWKADAVYRVAVPAYMLSGGDGFNVLKTPLRHFSTGTLDTDILVQYLKTEVPVTAQLEGRVTFVHSGKSGLGSSLYPPLIIAAILISSLRCCGIELL